MGTNSNTPLTSLKASSSGGGSGSVDTSAITEIKELLENETYGLSVLKSYVDENESLLKDSTYGLSALKTYMTNTLVNDGVNGLSRISMYATENNQLLKMSDYSLPTLKDKIDSIITKLNGMGGGGTSYPNITTDTLNGGSVTVSGKGKLLMYGISSAIVVCSFSVDGSETLGINLGTGNGSSNNNTMQSVQVTFEKSIEISISTGILRYFIQLA